jgi:hypothetical protein
MALAPAQIREPDKPAAIASAVRNRRAGKEAVEKSSFAEGFCELRFKAKSVFAGQFPKCAVGLHPIGAARPIV